MGAESKLRTRAVLTVVGLVIALAFLPMDIAPGWWALCMVGIGTCAFVVGPLVDQASLASRKRRIRRHIYPRHWY
jgi:hypothetical protein